MQVITVTGVLVPKQAVPAGRCSDNSVISIINILVKELITLTLLIAEPVYLTADDVIVIIQPLEARSSIQALQFDF